MITMKQIVMDGHPLLRSIVSEVKLPLSDEDKQLMKDLFEFLCNGQNKKSAKKYSLAEGVGIAASQIGIDKRIIAIRTEDEKDILHEYVLANPKVISHSEEMAYLPNGEGCLSVENEIDGFVPRHRRVTVKGIDLEGNEVTIKAKDTVAIVLQHEIDHLNGKMFYDYINEKAPLMPPQDAYKITLDQRKKRGKTDAHRKQK